MRMIDADKLVNDIAEHITVKAVSRVLAITQGQPTVEAIPVEWLRKYVDEHDEIVEEGLYWIVEEIIDDWREENGTDRQE